RMHFQFEPEASRAKGTKGSGCDGMAHAIAERGQTDCALESLAVAHEQHAAFAGEHHLVCLETEAGSVGAAADWGAVDCGTECMRAVLDDSDTERGAFVCDGVDISRMSPQVRNHDAFRARRDHATEGVDIDVAGIRFNVAKDDTSPGCEERR